MMRDKIEHIMIMKVPMISFQLVRLVKLEDWIAYIQTLSLLASRFQRSGGWYGQIDYIALFRGLLEPLR
jgi:hypothetical protein